MREITNSEFAPEAGKIVIVEFGASWCGSCRASKQVLEEFSKEHPDVDVCTVDVDENEELVSEYQIRSVPAIFFYNDCEKRATHVGGITKQILEQKYAETLK